MEVVQRGIFAPVGSKRCRDSAVVVTDAILVVRRRAPRMTNDVTAAGTASLHRISIGSRKQ